MKDLTHYFVSPKRKEQSNALILSDDSNHSNCDASEKTDPLQKKQKLKLSKSKLNEAKGNKISVKTVTSEPEATIDKADIRKSNVLTPENNSAKKRKLVEANDVSTKRLKTAENKDYSSKKPKTSRPNKPNKSKSDCKKSKHKSLNGVVKDNKVQNCEEVEEKDVDFSSNMVREETVKDEPVIKVNKKKKSKQLFIESDEDTSDLSKEVTDIEKSPDILDSLNDEISPKSSRNSLFSYFNKVDKSVALMQKSEKIKVEVLVHFPPVAEKVVSNSSQKLLLTKKTKKSKSKKIEFDDSDTIEVLSSEYILDENCSIGMNGPVESNVEENHKSLKVNDVSYSEKQNTKNLASIFMQKRNSDKSDIHNEKGTQNVSIKLEEKLEKEGKPMKKSLNLSKVPTKTKDDPENTEDDSFRLQDETKSSNRKTKKTKAVKSNLKSSRESLNENKLPAPENSEHNTKSRGKTSLTETTPKVVKPDKESKMQPKGVNGYFSLNDQHSSKKKKVENNSSNKMKSSPWVMKVRLNNTLETLPDSGDDSKGEEETKSSEHEDNEEIEDLAEIVVLDDDEDPVEVSQETSNRRSSLRRRAKNANPTPKDGRKTVVESPKPSVKMWPFFQKGGAQKSKELPVDEAKLQARKLFLGSGVPESIKRKVEAVHNEVVLGNPAPFPAVSHVTCADTSELTGVECRLPLSRSPSPSVTVPPWQTLSERQESDEPEIPVFQRPGNIKAFLEKLKEEEPKTEVKALYKTLKEYKVKAETDAWTDIYRPKKAADMVGNSESIKKLKTWLETLKNRRKREGSESSGDEFVDEDSEESNAYNNMAIISGPYGCGKTSAVYAIANELDCKVLEINASCNRSGKRILAEFSESTQSHQVERTQSVNGLFNSQNGRKSKKKKKSKLSEKVKSEKTSLILVEDADLLFSDIDEGFMQALSSLAATSKRPLILVTNQTRNPHLERFQNTRLLKMTFARPKAAKLGLWLRLVGLVEGVAVTAEQAARLVHWSACDVRRSLMQLQLMVHSNNSEMVGPTGLNSLWWRWPATHRLSYELPTLLEPEDPPPPPARDKRQLLDQLRAVANTTRQLATLDVLTPQDLLCSREEDDPCPLWWRAACQDSTVLVPHGHDDDDVFGPRQELATWLARAAVRDMQQTTERLGQTSQEARWLSILRQGEQLFLSGISTTTHTNHVSVSCDYMPYLRDLGRAEEVRLAHYTRRANRFFNYLQGIGIHASKSFRDFMCDAFS